jgi:hypothetical protein
MAKKPTQAQIRAVHHAMYKRHRLQALKQHVADVRRAMNLNPEIPLSPQDIRNPPGSGPNWYIHATGAVDGPVLDAAEVCDKIANTFLDIRHDVGQVDFPDKDKHHLMTALKEEAASWTARGHAWRNPNANNVEAQVNSISKHVQAGMQAAQHVQRYLVSAPDLGL